MEDAVRYRTLILLLFVAAFIGVAVWRIYSSPIKFEEEAVKAEMKESGPQMQAALAQYPQDAPRVVVLYGHTEDLHEVFRDYGHNQIVPIVVKCLEGGDDFLAMSFEFEKAVTSLIRFRWPSGQKLEPVECGWRAILLTKIAGSDFLRQFRIKEGKAYRLPGTTVLSLATDFLTSGLKDVEKKLVVGERITASEWGMAALDVAMVGAAGKSVAMVVRGKTAALPKAARMSAARQGITGFARNYAPKIAKYATLTGGVYLMIYHPGVITGALGTLAEVLGLPSWLFQVTFWGIVLFVLSWVVSTILFFPRTIYRLLGR